LKARGLAEKGKWSEALLIMNNYANDTKLQPTCQEYVALFKAHSYFKELEESDKEQKDYVKAADHFQDMISFYPDSGYVPYALTSLGKIYLLMGDNNQAEGYFHIVKNTYKDSYPGIPEIMFELGWIYTEKNDAQLAIDTLKDVVARFPSGAFIGKAKLKLGKALFNTGDYSEAIRIFEELIAEKPEMVFQSSELLFYLGNAYFQTGKFEKAMENLLKVYNLYPEIEGRDTLLTRIGDIMLEMKKKDQAVKIFKLVTKKYPKTDGFVISTMRLAEYLDNREEKEKMYSMVITDYPGNPLAQLAMMRLALLQNQAKQYEKSIETVKALLVYKPKELQKDAVRLIQDSSGYIFKALLAADDTTELISRYETDRKYLDDMESPAIFFSVGMAYLKSHLFENAVATLQKAYNRTGERGRSKELIHALGVSMDEAGRDDEALELFANYLKRFPGGPDTAEVCSRMGQIFFEKKQYNKAIAILRKAYERTGDAKDRVRILVEIAKNNSELGNYGSAVATLENAAALLSGDPEGYADILGPVFKNMAENHMKLKQWGKAANALTKAVEITTTPSELTEIYFLMGETYQHMKKINEATSSYTYVVDNGDSFWSGMARERLRIMNLKDKLDKNN
jgi:TolA-binding protein